MNFIYEITFGSGERLIYKININRVDTTAEVNPAEHPWIYLKIHKCPNCPLKTKKNKICPAAAEIAVLFKDFENKLSYDKVKVRVVDNEREYRRDCDLQTALNSMLGLILATCKCPILSKLKYMAFSHIPIASFEETLKRSVGLYLIKQLFIHRDGGVPDLQLIGLANLYDDLKIINTNLHKRLLTSSRNDANVNAIHAFFSLSSLVGISINENLDEIRSIFE